MIKNNKRTRPHPRSPLDLSGENSFNYLSFTKKIQKYLSFNQNQKKDDKMKNIKKNEIINYFLNSNNSQNLQTNNNTIKSAKKKQNSNTVFNRLYNNDRKKEKEKERKREREREKEKELEAYKKKVIKANITNKNINRNYYMSWDNNTCNSFINIII